MPYQFQTTFWMDFSIADKFGAEAIKDTFRRAFNEWKDNHIYLTELTLVMNWKCNLWYEKGNTEYYQLYYDYYYKCRDYGYDNLKGNELNYFHNTID